MAHAAGDPFHIMGRAAINPSPYLDVQKRMQRMMNVIAPEVLTINKRFTHSVAPYMNEMMKTHRFAENVMAPHISQLASISQSIDIAGKSMAIQWAANSQITSQRWKEMMATIYDRAGVKLDVPSVELFMRNVPKLTDELEGSRIEEAADELVGSDTELSIAIERQAELMVDYTDPEHRRIIVRGIKVAVYLAWVMVIVGAGTVSLAAAQILGILGFTAHDTANYVGGKVDGALEKKASEEDTEDHE